MEAGEIGVDGKRVKSVAAEGSKTELGHVIIQPHNLKEKTVQLMVHWNMRLKNAMKILAQVSNCSIFHGSSKYNILVILRLTGNI